MIVEQDDKIQHYCKINQEPYLHLPLHSYNVQTQVEGKAIPVTGREGP
jgi:hypothetical protein